MTVKLSAYLNEQTRYRKIGINYRIRKSLKSSAKKHGIRRRLMEEVAITFMMNHTECQQMERVNLGRAVSKKNLQSRIISAAYNIKVKRGTKQ